MLDRRGLSLSVSSLATHVPRRTEGHREGRSRERESARMRTSWEPASTAWSSNGWLYKNVSNVSIAHVMRRRRIVRLTCILWRRVRPTCMRARLWVHYVNCARFRRRRCGMDEPAEKLERTVVSPLDAGSMEGEARRENASWRGTTQVAAGWRRGVGNAPMCRRRCRRGDGGRLSRWLQEQWRQ